MSFSLSLQPDQSDEQIYHDLLPQIKSLLDPNDNIISNLSNFTALLQQAFTKISWVGFYLYDGSRLVLGPFQGKVACTSIVPGKGVCGAAAAQRITFIVPDVHAFPGHIACDTGSNSEIVVPMVRNGKLIGVLDLDSYLLNAFSTVDQKYLEQAVHFICNDILNKDSIF